MELILNIVRIITEEEMIMEDMIEILFDHVEGKDFLNFEEKIKLLSALEIDFLSSIARPHIIDPNLYYYNTGNEIYFTQLNMDLINFWDAFKEFYEDEDTFNQNVFVKLCKALVNYNALIPKTNYKEAWTILMTNFNI